MWNAFDWYLRYELCCSGHGDRWKGTTPSYRLKFFRRRVGLRFGMVGFYQYDSYLKPCSNEKGKTFNEMHTHTHVYICVVCVYMLHKYGSDS